jgi:hypothetical protein
MPNYISVLKQHEDQIIAGAAAVGGVTLLTYKDVQAWLDRKGITHYFHNDKKAIPAGHTYYEIK